MTREAQFCALAGLLGSQPRRLHLTLFFPPSTPFVFPLVGGVARQLIGYHGGSQLAMEYVQLELWRIISMMKGLGETLPLLTLVSASVLPRDSKILELKRPHR